MGHIMVWFHCERVKSLRGKWPSKVRVFIHNIIVLIDFWMIRWTLYVYCWPVITVAFSCKMDWADIWWMILNVRLLRDFHAGGTSLTNITILRMITLTDLSRIIEKVLMWVSHLFDWYFFLPLDPRNKEAIIYLNTYFFQIQYLILIWF